MLSARDVLAGWQQQQQHGQQQCWRCHRRRHDATERIGANVTHVGGSPCERISPAIPDDANNRQRHPNGQSSVEIIGAADGSLLGASPFCGQLLAALPGRQLPPADKCLERQLPSARDVCL